MKTNQEIETQPLLNIDLRLFILPALYFMIFYLPLGRGLYFEPELLPFQMAVAVLFAVLWVDKVVRRDMELLPGRIQSLDIFALLFVFAYFQSVFVAVDERAAVAGVLKALMYVLFYRVVAELSMDRKVRDRILSVLFLSGVMVALIGLTSAMGLFRYPGAVSGLRISSTLQYPNALAAYLLMVHIIGLSQWARRIDGWSALFYGLGNFTFILVIISSLSRATWIIFPFAVGLLILLAPKDKRWSIIYLEIVALSAGAVAANGLFQALRSSGEMVGLKWILAGLAIIIAGQIGYWLVQRSLDRFRVSDLQRQFLKVGVVLYTIIVVLIYISYVGQVLPHALYQVVPEPVFGRASTINTTDNSLLARLYSSSDGVQIIKDYSLRGTGAGGWNALYHQYQSYLYWTTEVHNHYVQVWIEAGLLGILSYALIWLSVIYILYKLLRNKTDEDQWLISAGVGVGVLALGTHSAVDFDLSLPGLMLVVWVAFGLLRGQIAEEEPKELGKSSFVAGLGKFFLVFLVAFLLYVPSSRMYNAGKVGALAAQALLRDEYAVAETQYLEAHRLDPFKGSYAVDLAQIYTFYGLSTGDTKWFDEALTYLAYGLEKQPNNLTLRSKAIEVLVRQGRWDLAISQTEWLTTNLPLDIRSYETMAQVSLLAAQDALDKGNKAASRTYLDKALVLPARVDSTSQAITDRGLKINRRPLRSTPTLELYSGQAWLLKGDTEAARSFLEPLIKNKDVGKEATIWLAVIEYLEGNLEGSAVLLLALADDEQALSRFEKILWSYRELQEY